MIKIKTFGEPLQPFKAQRELEELDGRCLLYTSDAADERVRV